MSQDQQWNALKRIIRRLPAQSVYYASALGAIVLAGGGQLPPGLEFVAGSIGANVLHDMIKDIANDEDILDDEIRSRAEDAIEQSDIANLLTKQDFLQGYARLIQRLDAQKEISEDILSELRSGFDKVATADQVAELKALILKFMEESNKELAFKAEHTELIFISYARDGGGREFASTLRNELASYGFKLWQDVVNMEGGKGWFKQIQEAIRGSVVMVLILNDDALKSPNVRDEWNYARQIGIPILPVTWNKTIFEDAPRWLGKHHVFILDPSHEDYKTQRISFIKQLNNPPDTKPVPFTVPRLPDQFVERPKKFNPIIDKLLDNEHQSPVALTTALQGGGGFGKTVLAVAICHDLRIRAAFDDGILWLQFRENTTQADVVTMLNGVIRELGGIGNHTVEQYSAASAEWRALLKDRDMLIVLDDVWKAHLPQHVLLGEHDGKGHTAFIITTRKADVVARASADKVSVDMLEEDEDLQLLAKYISDKTDDFSPLKDFVLLLGRWALLIDLTGAQLRMLMESSRTLADAVNYVKIRFQERGITFMELGVADEENRNLALSTSLDASIAQFPLIPSDVEQRFYELSIFPEDTKVSVDAVQRLWHGVAGYSAIDTEDTLEIMNQLSLFLHYEPNVSLQLHDVIRQVIAPRLDDDCLINKKLVQEYGDLTHLPDDYAWRNIAHHLINAQQNHVLENLILKYDFLYNKINKTNLLALDQDFNLLNSTQPQITLLQSALNMARPILQTDMSSLPNQLIGRLGHYSIFEKLITEAKNRAKLEPKIILESATLQPAGTELQTSIVGHSNSVIAVDIKETIASSIGQDYKVQIVDWKTTELLKTLTLNNSSHYAFRLRPSMCSISDDEHHIIITGDDGKILIWEWEENRNIRVLKAPYTSSINSHIIVGSYLLTATIQGIIDVWNWKEGSHIRRLVGHTNSVSCVSVADSFAISFSSDNTIKVWNWTNGQLIRTLSIGSSFHYAKHMSIVDNFAFIASDSTIKIWNWVTGEYVNELKGHTKSVNSIAVEGEFAISGSSDNTIKIWNWSKGELLRTLKGHSNTINHVATRGEVAISASSDSTIKIWNWRHKPGIQVLSQLQKYENSKAISSLSITQDYVCILSDQVIRIENVWTNDIVLETTHENAQHIYLKDKYLLVVGHERTSNWYTQYIVNVEVYTWQDDMQYLYGTQFYDVRNIRIDEDKVLIVNRSKVIVFNWQTQEVVYDFGLKITSKDDVSEILDARLCGSFLITNTRHSEKIKEENPFLFEWEQFTINTYILEIHNWETGHIIKRMESQNTISVIAFSKQWLLIKQYNSVSILDWPNDKLVRRRILESSQNSVEIQFITDIYFGILEGTLLCIESVNESDHVVDFRFDYPQKFLCVGENFMCSSGDFGQVHILRLNELLLKILENDN